MMTCGHSPNGKDANTGKPVCVICNCETVQEDPDLKGREAKCMYCGSIMPSNVGLPFFEYRNNKANDSYYDGCRGFD